MTKLYLAKNSGGKVTGILYESVAFKIVDPENGKLYGYILTVNGRSKNINDGWNKWAGLVVDYNKALPNVRGYEWLRYGVMGNMNRYAPIPSSWIEKIKIESIPSDVISRMQRQMNNFKIDKPEQCGHLEVSWIGDLRIEFGHSDRGGRLELPNNHWVVKVLDDEVKIDIQRLMKILRYIRNNGSYTEILNTGTTSNVMVSITKDKIDIDLI